MITINYQGNNPTVAQATENANQLLQDNNFFQQIASHPNFDLATATPSQVASILQNSNFQMTVEFYKTLYPFSKALAYDDPAHPLTVHLNQRRLNRSAASICATIIHEAVHAADAMESNFSFGHSDNSSVGKQNTAPYWIDNLAYTIISGGQPASIVFQHDLISNDIAIQA